jgi:hypothetical protein
MRLPPRHSGTLGVEQGNGRRDGALFPDAGLHLPGRLQVGGVGQAVGDDGRFQGDDGLAFGQRVPDLLAHLQ